MKKKWFYLSFLVFCLLLTSCTIVSIEEVEQRQKSETFDPVSYVDSVWESRIVPTITEKAVDLPKVLEAVQEDLAKAGEQYAKISVSGAYNFMVKGSGVVESVDTSSSNGIAVIKLDSYQGPIVVKLQIGPRISGDSVRDSVGFIEFGMFKEQTEYGKVSREINKRIADTVVKDLNVKQLPSKSVTFYGAFTIRTTNQTDLKIKEVVIVPVKIEVK